MRGIVVLLFVACGPGDDVVPPDVVRVQLFEDGLPFRNVPVYYGTVEGTLENETETDLDGIAEARVGDRGIVTIVVRDTITSVQVEAGTLLTYELPFASTVRSPLEVGTPGALPEARDNGYRLTDGCGTERRFRPLDRVSWEANWQCVGQTGEVDVVAWAEAPGGQVVGVSTLLGVTLPIGGLDDGGVLPNWSTSLAEVGVSWTNRAKEGPAPEAIAVGVREGRRHRGASERLRDPEGSTVLAYGPTGFADLVDVRVRQSQEADTVEHVVRRTGADPSVSVDLGVLEPAVDARWTGAAVEVEHLRDAGDGLATTVELVLVDEEGASFPLLAVGGPGAETFVIPELPYDDEPWTVDEKGSFRVGKVAGDSISSAEYIGGWLYREPGHRFTPVGETPGSWTFWRRLVPFVEEEKKTKP